MSDTLSKRSGAHFYQDSDFLKVEVNFYLSALLSFLAHFLSRVTFFARRNTFKINTFKINTFSFKKHSQLPTPSIKISVDFLSFSPTELFIFVENLLNIKINHFQKLQSRKNFLIKINPTYNRTHSLKNSVTFFIYIIKRL